MPVNAREAALKSLSACRKNGAWSDAALNNILKKEALHQTDASLAARVFYGVLQNMALLDYYISAYSTVKTSKMEPLVLDILRLSVYQLVFLSKIPQSAAVNEGVTLTKKHSNPRAAGLVNAVLRKVASNLGQLPEIKGADECARMSIKYSHPEWLVKKFCGLLGAEGAEALLLADNTEAAICAHVNTLKTSLPAVLHALEQDCVEAPAHPWLEHCVLLRGTGSIERLEAYSDGSIYIQDPAARLAVLAAAPKPGMVVLDACAAPGGKSFTSAVEMKNTGRILACDIHEKKLQRIQRGAARLGITVLETRVMDARLACEELKNQADVVIADVPCSGFGVIRKKPEIRYKRESDIEKLPRLQSDILSNLSAYVKPGGILLYSTCTLLPEENEGVVNAFLQEHRAFSPEAFRLPGPIGNAESGMTTLWPHMSGTDGFFICKLRRKS
jgi:16S rRNA (cytosine967-C5)-methyltransferase